MGTAAKWDTFNILPSEFKYAGNSKRRTREVVYPSYFRTYTEYEPVLLNELVYAYGKQDTKKEWQSIFQVYLAEVLCIKQSKLKDRHFGGTYTHTTYEVQDSKNIRRILTPLTRMALCG